MGRLGRLTRALRITEHRVLCHLGVFDLDGFASLLNTASNGLVTYLSKIFLRTHRVSEESLFSLSICTNCFDYLIDEDFPDWRKTRRSNLTFETIEEWLDSLIKNDLPHRRLHNIVSKSAFTREQAGVSFFSVENPCPELIVYRVQAPSDAIDPGIVESLYTILAYTHFAVCD
ncbi:hypothetical protein Tco_0988686 [Tanacetum coccineum]|uniref:Uncharacterized protein n=1 Tax=Tanacetum coccineum TaxID=301880 RepID=A0ABQ5ESX1_9ASTR